MIFVNPIWLKEEVVKRILIGVDLQVKIIYVQIEGVLGSRMCVKSVEKQWNIVPGSEDETGYYTRSKTVWSNLKSIYKY